MPAAALATLIAAWAGSPAESASAAPSLAAPSVRDGVASAPPAPLVPAAAVASAGERRAPPQPGATDRVVADVPEGPPPWSEPWPRSLVVEVRRDGHPIADARVTVWPVDAPERVLRTDRNGRARFDGLTAGCVGARADIGADHVQLASGCTPFLTDGLVLRLGTASIHGVVCTDAGAPLADVAVTAAAPHGAAHTRTAADGSFHLTGLARERYAMHVRGAKVGDAERVVVLADGGRALVRFGRPPGVPFATWRGRVRDGAGGTVPGVRSLFATCVGLGEVRTVRTDEDGSFAVALPAGTWDVCLVEGGAAGQRLATLELDGRPFAQDLVLPGTRLRVEFVPADGAAAAARAHRATFVLYGAKYASWSGTTTTVDAQHAVVEWTCVAPGEYRIGSHDAMVVGGLGGVARVAIAPGPPVVALRLAVAVRDDR